MTTPPDAPSNSDAATRRLDGMALATAAVLIALKAFALGASGSVSALAGLTESGLVFISLGAGLITERRHALLSTPRAGLTEAMVRLVLSGMALASATFVGVIALIGIFDPRPVGGGSWPVIAVIASLIIAAALIAYARPRALRGDDRGSGYTDLVPGIVVLIGVAAGALMNAPGLDAAAALVVAVWLFWGAFGPIRSAAVALGVQRRPD